MFAATDPNLFRLDWERTIEVLAAIVLLSMLLERALSLVFESRLYIDLCSRRRRNDEEEDGPRRKQARLLEAAVS